MFANPWVQRALGVVAVVGCYVLAGTVMKGSGYEKEVASVGTFVLGWLGFSRPGQAPKQ